MDTSSDEPSKAKDPDEVGYKRPPVEHQFKKGQKPPPRKKKVQKEISARDLLWKILQERRRVTADGKAAWLTNAELVGRRAFLEAEKGSATLQRLINELWLGSEREPQDEQPELVTNYDGPELGENCAIRTVWIEERPLD